MTPAPQQGRTHGQRWRRGERECGWGDEGELAKARLPAPRVRLTTDFCMLPAPMRITAGLATSRYH